MKSEVVFDVGHPCHGHPCDGCARCLAGECCGADVVDAELPAEGSYSGAVLAVGTWDENAEGIACHICGQRKQNLASHVLRAHSVDADHYRAYFGLACTRPLISEAMRLARSERAVGRDPEVLSQNRPTSEQMSVVSFAREQRAEIRALRKRQFTPEHNQGAARAKWSKYRSDVAYQLGVRRNLIKARRRRMGANDRHCTVCECWFCPLGGKSYRLTCSDECANEAKARAAKVRWGA